MDKILFDKIFDSAIEPEIRELNDNNPMIVLNDLQTCKAKLYREYCILNDRYKDQVFGKDEEALLDRHKIAACICGAFLKVPIFNKTRLIEYIQKERPRLEAYFYYVNELVALFSASRFLLFFMIAEREGAGDHEAADKLLRDFPSMPLVNQSKDDFWSSVLFNLSQVKDETQIGLDHYDMYSYAMFFYWLENYYNEITSKVPA